MTNYVGQKVVISLNSRTSAGRFGWVLEVDLSKQRAKIDFRDGTGLCDWIDLFHLKEIEPSKDERLANRKYKFYPVDGQPYEDQVTQLTLHLPGGGVRILKPEDIPMGFTCRYYIQGDKHLVMSIASIDRENELIPYWRLEHLNAQGITFILEGPTGAVPTFNFVDQGED